MTQLVFVLGKNWLLSMAEVIVYLEDERLLKSLVDYSKTAAVISTTRPVTDEDIIDIQSALGGCYKIGRHIVSYDSGVLEKAYPIRGTHSKKDREVISKCEWLSTVWLTPRAKRIKYAVSTYPIEEGESKVDLRRFTRGMNESIKTKLIKENARKVDYLMYEEPDRRKPERSNTALWPQTIARHNLLKFPNAEILAVLTDSKVHLAKTVTVYDSMLQQYRDESRPHISSEISTSPKICRTLLTLSGARPGSVVLDPFCGTGTLLMEAALQEMRCIGIDIDRHATEGAKANLRWLGKELGSQLDFVLISGDARDADKLVNRQVDAIAFEPHLGPVFKEKPELEETEQLIDDLTILYRDALKSLTKILRPEGRIAMTVPVVRAKGREVSIDFNKMLRRTGLQLYRFLPSHIIDGASRRVKSVRINPNRGALPERKQGQIVQRMVIMLGRG